MASNMKIKKKSSEKTFDIINGAFLLILVILVAYPLYYVLIASISDPYEVYAGKTFLLPSKITFEGYKRVFKENSIAGGYLNSIYYTVLGTVVSVALVLTTGYCMSKKTLPFRRAIMIFYVITMYVGGGLIPTYLVVSKMHMLNSVWALILPGGVSVYNVIVTRTFFETSIPQELYEAASIDGATSGQVFFKITLPLLMPILLYVAITSLIGGLQMFDVPQIITAGSGSPNNSCMTLIMYLNRLIGSGSKNYGMGGAVSVVIFILTGALSMIVFKTMVTSDDKPKKKAKKVKEAVKNG